MKSCWSAVWSCNTKPDLTRTSGLPILISIPSCTIHDSAVWRLKNPYLTCLLLFYSTSPLASRIDSIFEINTGERLFHGQSVQRFTLNESIMQTWMLPNKTKQNKTVIYYILYKCMLVFMVGQPAGINVVSRGVTFTDFCLFAMFVRIRSWDCSRCGTFLTDR